MPYYDTSKKTNENTKTNTTQHHHQHHTNIQNRYIRLGHIEHKRCTGTIACFHDRLYDEKHYCLLKQSGKRSPVK